MPTDLKILGWSAKGLRCPDHDLSFENGSGVYKISLVQMPNGTGKTTTLKLLRAALTGPDIWKDDFDKVDQLRKNQQTEQGQFELRLLYNGRRLTIQMQFDFITKAIAERKQDLNFQLN
jgi:DNA sulfur modification protein DndD